MANEAYDAAQLYLTQMLTYGTDYIANLETINYSAPTISVSWNSLAPPSLPAIPSAPTMPTISVNMPTDEPDSLSLAEPTITIDDFTELPPTISIGAAPTVSYGTAPIIPEVGEVSIPSAPVVVTPEAPSYLGLTTITFGGVDMHEDWLANLENMPTLTLVEPTPYSFSPSPEYSSSLLTLLKAQLSSRLAGGTGLSPAVEQAIWDRARDRETDVWQANITEVQRRSDALGFSLPSGTLAAQMREASQTYFGKLSELSRDVAIKQADLEQTNLKQTLDVTLQLESSLIEYSYKIEQLAFQSAKELADNAIQIYNASIEGFKALIVGYQAYASTYKVLIDGELAKVEVYKAQLQGEQIKAQINTALVEQYKALISAGLAQVEVYKAQVGGANTLIQLEQTKISAAGERVRAYTAQVNAETAKVEAYKAGVQAEVAKSDVYKSTAQAFSAKVGAQAEKAKAEVTRYTALTQAKTAEWEGFKTRVQTESIRVEALGKQSSTLLEGFKAESHAVEASANLQTRLWETEIKQYEAGQNIIIQQAKMNNDAWLSTRNMATDAAKVGAQIYGQLTAAALGQVHTTLSDSMSRNISYSYSNETTSTVPPML